MEGGDGGSRDGNVHREYGWLRCMMLWTSPCRFSETSRKIWAPSDGLKEFDAARIPRVCGITLLHAWLAKPFTATTAASASHVDVMPPG